MSNVLDVYGRIRVRHTSETAGIWFSNVSNGLTSADGAFFGILDGTAGSERAGIYIGDAWQFVVKRNGYTGILTPDPTVPLHVNSPSGSTNSTNGAVIFGTLAGLHMTFDTDEINVYNGTVGTTPNLNPNTSSNVRVHGYTKLGFAAPAIQMKELTGTTAATEGYGVTIPHGIASANKILSSDVHIEYATDHYVPAAYNRETNEHEVIYYYNSTNIYIINKDTASASVLSKPIKILVTYKE